jgi:hypothetical protein
MQHVTPLYLLVNLILDRFKLEITLPPYASIPSECNDGSLFDRCSTIGHRGIPSAIQISAFRFESLEFVCYVLFMYSSIRLSEVIFTLFTCFENMSSLSFDLKDSRLP